MRDTKYSRGKSYIKVTKYSRGKSYTKRHTERDSVPGFAEGSPQAFGWVLFRACMWKKWPKARERTTIKCHNTNTGMYTDPIS